MFMGIGILTCFIAYDVVNLTKILCMHNGCQQYKNNEEEQEIENTKFKVHIYNQLRNTIEKMYKDARAKVQNNIDMGRSKPKSFDVSFVRDDIASPSPSDVNNSFMSKVKSAIDNKTEYLVDNKDDEILENYRKFFIERKTAIIDEWLKIRLKSIKQKVKKNKNKFVDINMDKSRNPHNLSQSSFDKDYSEENDETLMHPSDEELEIANEFLNKFLIQSEASIDGHIDLNLVLKAIPNKIKDFLIHRVELFNFRIFQDSLIAHQNKEIVDAFEDFDMRNKDRVYSIKEKLLRQKVELVQIREVLSSVQDLNVNHHRSASADKDKLKRKIIFEKEVNSEFKAKNYDKLSRSDND